MKDALKSFIEAVELAGGAVTAEMLRGDVYGLLSVLDSNNVRFYYAGPKLSGTKTGRQYPISFEHKVGYAVVTIAFERCIDGDEMDLMSDAFRNGKTRFDPDKDLIGAVVSQLTREIQQAYDQTGISGQFETVQAQLDTWFGRKPIVGGADNVSHTS